MMFVKFVMLTKITRFQRTKSQKHKVGRKVHLVPWGNSKTRFTRWEDFFAYFPFLKPYEYVQQLGVVPCILQQKGDNNKM